MDDTTAASGSETPDLGTMGRRIAAARKRAGYTQHDLADRVGVTFQAVSKWETDGSMPDVALLVPIAGALGLSLDQLLTGEGYPAPIPEPAPGAAAEAEAPRAIWGRIMGEVTKDIHGDVGTIMGEVRADIHGNVHGDIIGEVRNVYGNVAGSIIGEVHGDITGYVGGRLLGTVYGHVKGGVRGRILGTIVGDGINIEGPGGGRRRGRGGRRRDPNPS